jgi:hypothetical protein
MNIEIPYYEDKTRISNSNIGWFLNKGPAYLYKMLTEDVPEEKNSTLERGTMIHEYLLQPEEFQKDYVVWNKSRPSSTQQEAFCQALASSTEIEPNRAILDAYKQAYSTRGKSDDLMLSEGLKIVSTLKDYIDFLKANDGRTMITPWDVKMLEKIKRNIDHHKLASKLLCTPGNMYDDESKCTWMCRHEFHINWEYDINSKVNPRKVLCKSLLDSVVFEFNKKICTIMDLKTTQKLWRFEESVDTYDYLRQLCYYTMAVKWYLKNECNEDPDEWDFDFFIIAIDTTGSYDIRVFEIEPYTVMSRKDVITNALFAISWHQVENKWEHSREYYEGDGSESLNL